MLIPWNDSKLDKKAMIFMSQFPMVIMVTIKNASQLIILLFEELNSITV